MDGFFELSFVWIQVVKPINPMKNATTQNQHSKKKLINVDTQQQYVCETRFTLKNIT